MSSETNITNYKNALGNLSWESTLTVFDAQIMEIQLYYMQNLKMDVNWTAYLL